MKHVAILLGTIRNGRQSLKVALYFYNYISQNNIATTEIIDLKDFDFPVFEERLRFLKTPPQNALDFKEKIVKADAIIVVSPEYNGSFPAALKNAVDLLKDEWFHKPLGLVTVSAGVFGGLKCQIALQLMFQHIKALVSPIVFPVPEVETEFQEEGKPAQPEPLNKRADIFVKELLWIADKNI